MEPRIVGQEAPLVIDSQTRSEVAMVIATMTEEGVTTEAAIIVCTTSVVEGMTVATTEGQGLHRRTNPDKTPSSIDEHLIVMTESARDDLMIAEETAETGMHTEKSRATIASDDRSTEVVQTSVADEQVALSLSLIHI